MLVCSCNTSFPTVVLLSQLQAQPMGPRSPCARKPRVAQSAVGRELEGEDPTAGETAGQLAVAAQIAFQLDGGAVEARVWALLTRHLLVARTHGEFC